MIPVSLFRIIPKPPRFWAPGNPVITAGALAINPINWKRDETLATAAENLGSIGLNKDGSAKRNAEGIIAPVMNFADAQSGQGRADLQHR